MNSVMNDSVDARRFVCSSCKQIHLKWAARCSSCLETKGMETRTLAEIDTPGPEASPTPTVPAQSRAGEGRCPVTLRSVVLLNGGLFPETHRPVLTQRLLHSPLGPLVAMLMTRERLAATMRRIGGRSPPDAAEIDAFWSLLSRDRGRRAMPRLIRYIDERRAQRARWLGALQRATVPITLIDGTADPISGAHMVARFRQLVPAAHVVELPDVGHYPQIEAPAAVVAAAVAAFDAATDRR